MSKRRKKQAPGEWCCAWRCRHRRDAGGPAPASAQDFSKGKTINILVGFRAGWRRMTSTRACLARHMDGTSLAIAPWW